MAVTDVLVTSFTTGTTAAATVAVDVSSKFSASNPWRVAILQTVSLSADGRNDGSFSRSQGFVTRDNATIQQVYCSSWSTDAGANSATARGVNNDACLKTYSAATPTVDSEIDCTAVSDTQITFTITDAPASSYVVRVMVLGGTGWTGARAVRFTTDLSSTADQTIALRAGFGLVTHALWGTAGASVDGDQAGAARMAFGVSNGLGTGATIGRTACFVESNGAANMTCAVYRANSGLAIHASSNVLDGAFDLSTSQSADNLVIDWTTASTTAYRVIGVALQLTSDVAWGVGSIAAPTAAAPQAQQISFGGVAKGAIMFSTGVALSDNTGSDTATDLGGFAMGFSDGTTQGAGGACQKDADATASTGRWQSSTKGLMLCAPVAAGTNPPTLLSEADVTPTVGGADLNWTTTTTGKATNVEYVLFGELSAPNLNMAPYRGAY